MLATMCIITVSIMWPHFCWVSVAAMINLPILSISSVSVSIFRQKYFFCSIFLIFTLFQVWRMAGFVTNFISYSCVVFHYWYPQTAPSDSTEQQVTDCHHCVASCLGRDGHARGVEVKSGQEGLCPGSGIVNRRKSEYVERLAFVKAERCPEEILG